MKMTETLIYFKLNLYHIFKVDKIFIDEDINQNETNTFTNNTALQIPLNESDVFLTQSQKNSHNIEQVTSRIEQLTPNMSRTNIPMLSTLNLSNETPRTRKNSQQSKAGLSEPPKQNIFLWNCIITIDDNRFQAQTGKKITIDRKSWINKIDEQTSNVYPFIYSLDGIGYPKNPMGRTGVRGRGALMRYGPNKEIMAIVTRWKKTKNRPIYVERKKLLEFIAVKDALTGSSIIPGDKILGITLL
jgi:hypothetical protein